jgi:uncharacterized protein DUF6894
MSDTPQEWKTQTVLQNPEPMPRFFFHVRDQHYLHEDQEGIELPDLQAVLEEALRTDRELAVEPAGLYGLEFEITDSSGRTVLKVPIRERRRNPDLPPLSGSRDEERRTPSNSIPKRLS